MLAQPLYHRELKEGIRVWPFLLAPHLEVFDRLDDRAGW